MPRAWLQGVQVKIGCPKEIKVHEYRVGLVPAGVRELAAAGHQVIVQAGAGSGIGIGDDCLPRRRRDRRPGRENRLRRARRWS